MTITYQKKKIACQELDYTVLHAKHIICKTWIASLSSQITVGADMLIRDAYIDCYVSAHDASVLINQSHYLNANKYIIAARIPLKTGLLLH